jgi:demethylmenaquinone methyltransferase / 2-methoxy-6-polyprenyl-1,4-benzoquinol methylase
VSRLRTTIATPEGKGPYVRRLFATIADRYDLITVLLSYGRDRQWKRRLVTLAGPLGGRRALDLACGTGDIAFSLGDGGATVTGLDLTPRMIELAIEKAGARGGGRAISFVAGDMMELPFASGCFDLVTTGYGLRNVPDLARAIAEARRVLVPGGLFLSLDFNRPSNPLVRTVYHAYLSIVGSAVGWALHRDPDTYRYIPESIRHYPGAPAVVSLLRRAGFVDARWERVLGGLMAIHVARVPK